MAKNKTRGDYLALKYDEEGIPALTVAPAGTKQVMVKPKATLRVWTLIYSHRHGSDVSVYATHEDAQVSKGSIILDWLDEVEKPQARKKIAEMIEGGFIDLAAEMYCEETGENFEIEAARVSIGLGEKWLRRRAKNALKEMADAEE